MILTVAGFAVFVCLFGGMFIGCCALLGWRSALFVYGVVALFVAIVVGGGWLIHLGGQTL